MEKEIQTQYRQAQKEITSKWNNYMDRAGKRLEGRQNALSSALASGDKDKIAEAKNALESAQKAVTLQDAKYKAMVEDTALRISESNQTAIDYINNRTPNIYANNYNQVNGIAENAGVQFRIINEDVVKKRIREGDIKLPKSRLSVPKDVRWNTKKMNSAVLQGILQGESMNDIAKRLLPIVDNNVNSALRNARTLVTQAENSGRLDSYKALEEEGAVLKKVWMATPDERTREAHLELDGQEVGIDEPFVDIDGNELMFPADPSADPATVYNCRCTMVTRIVSVNGNKTESEEEEPKAEETKVTETQVEEPQEESQNYYQPIQIATDENFTQKDVDEINNVFKKLDSEYGVPINSVISTLERDQREYDLFFENHVKATLEKNPKMRRSTAEKRAVELLGARPEKADIFRGGDFNMLTREMTLNTRSITNGCSTVKEEIAARREFAERQAKRAEEGRRVRPRGNVGEGHVTSFIHEYGHAVDAQYEVSTNPKFVDFYSKLNEEQITRGLSSYASTNAEEFIAEAFCESFMGDTQGELSKQFMSILEEIIK